MTDEGSGGGKRQKTKGKQDAPLSSPINPDLLTPSSRESLRTSYSDAKPWPHVVLRDLCTRERMIRMRQEITGLEASFKETDIFKVYQVRRDLMSFGEEMRSELPELLSLRDALYSQEFRKFIEDTTGCGPLTTQVDCSANVYSSSCHLLCHDDTIGTRRISYIIYFSDPDLEWTDDHGGSLELYPVDDKGKCDVWPTTVVLPTFNTCAVFRVDPGTSFHSVQEVFHPSNPRISIQGWFHAATEPANSERASRVILQNTDLQQVKVEDQLRGALVPFTGTIKELSTPSGVLSPEDAAYLSEWVNPVYLERGAINSIRNQFARAASVQLRDFLVTAKWRAIREAADREDYEDRPGTGPNSRPHVPAGEGPCPYRAGLQRSGWESVGPAFEQRFLRYSGLPASEGNNGSSSSSTGNNQAGPLLQQVAKTVISSAPFQRFLHQLTSLRGQAVRTEVRRFQPGLGYTCANTKSLTPVARLAATMCFVKEKPLPSSSQSDKDEVKDKSDGSSKRSDSDLWESGDVGGFQAYLPAVEEKDPDAAATYSADGDDDPLLQVPASDNTLNLVLHDPGTHQFVKYVSALAPGSRWDIAADMEVDPRDVAGPNDKDEGDEQDEGDQE